MEHYVEIKAIRVPANRQRRTFDEEQLASLSQSIAEVGLINPITVREGTDEGTWILVAGERRLKAISYNDFLNRPLQYADSTVPRGFIPVHRLRDLDNTALYQIELEENVVRQDLTWQDRTLAITQLAELRTMQAIRDGKPEPSNFDIGEEVTGTRSNGAQLLVSRSAIVARHLDKPEIARAKTLDEAFKLLRREDERDRSRALGDTLSAADLKTAHTLVHAEVLDWLFRYDGPSFDVLLTDPPYGIDAQDFGDSDGHVGGTTGEHRYDDSPAAFRQLMEEWIPAVATVLKEESHVYQFCDLEHFHYLRELWQASGYEVFRTPLVWFKPSAYRAPWPDRGPQRKYETILYGVRGGKTCKRLGGDVLQHNPDSNLGHSAQKPVSLYADLLSRSCIPADRVLDCFAGSGTIFPAAHSAKVVATGIERDPAFIGIAMGRIQQLEGDE